MTHCGYIAIIGRPNVGKSTLLNALLGKKLSITSRKPQTTRHRILGVKTLKDAQFIFVDTPGIHEKKSKLLNQYLNRAAFSALKEVDVVVWVIEAKGLKPEDELILEKLHKSKLPLLVVINKIDYLKNYNDLLPFIEILSKKMPHAEFVPLSALKEKNINALEKAIVPFLPESPFFFEQKMITDRPDTFIAAEMVREQLIRALGQELPYATMVSVTKFQKKKAVLYIQATIWVERDGQKKIVIGEGGKALKNIGQKARMSLEKYFGQKVFLELWVKVKSGWSEDERILREVLS